MSVAPWTLVGTETYAIAFPSRGEGASNVSLDRSPNDSRKDHAKSDSKTMTPFEAPYCSLLFLLTFRVFVPASGAGSLPSRRRKRTLWPVVQCKNPARDRRASGLPVTSA